MFQSCVTHVTFSCKACCSALPLNAFIVGSFDTISSGGCKSYILVLLFGSFELFCFTTTKTKPVDVWELMLIACPVISYI